MKEFLHWCYSSPVTVAWHVIFFGTALLLAYLLTGL